MEPWDVRHCALNHSNTFCEEEPIEDGDGFQDDPEWLIVSKVTALSILTYFETYIHKVPCRTSDRTGNKFMEEVLNGHEIRCYQAFRLTKPVFLDLCHELTQKYELYPTRGMSIYEEVGIFLMTCAHGTDNRLLQEIFNHSGETISRHFHRVLKVVGKLVEDIIKPHSEYNEGKGYHMSQHQRYKPFFYDCIGAIDGTHVKTRLPQGKEIPYIGRKGFPTQNILAVVDFNMCFTFVWAGWEGAAHDNRIFGEAIRRPELNFPHQKGKKYYLVDAGYSHMPGYMDPYKGENIRNCVERTFGVWKARWNILADMPYFHIDTQREIVLATMTIHNYIRKKNVSDEAFQMAEYESYQPSIERNISIANSTAENEDNPSNKRNRDIPIIFGQSFLATGGAKIDVKKGKLTTQIEDKEVTFNVFELGIHPEREREREREERKLKPDEGAERCYKIEVMEEQRKELDIVKKIVKMYKKKRDQIKKV
ncbi:uncharacterized protein [Henckelia pumila]|uniref:uncharacterized protein n=1 Tax=Henckelia pumila TaxID=405737 RepID=UPI003C6DEB2B